ncbi:MAG: FtsX-like permease family protein, partial [Phycisphaerales bacterium]
VVAQARGLESGGDPRFRMQEMREGRLPERAGEIAIDPMTAKALDCGMGAKLEVQRFGEPIALEVTGIIDRATLGALQRPYVVVERATLVEASGSDDASTVLVALRDGTPVLEWVAAHAPAFEEPLALEPSELFTTGFDRQVKAMRLGFVLVSLVAFMSCAFIVGTGMTTAVAEQQKELAIARCVGASRAQVFMSQVWAGAALCGAAGAAGVPVGIGLAAALRWWFREFLSDGFFLSGWGVGLSLASTSVARSTTTYGRCSAPSVARSMMPVTSSAIGSPKRCTSSFAPMPQSRAFAVIGSMAISPARSGRRPSRISCMRKRGSPPDSSPRACATTRRGRPSASSAPSARTRLRLPARLMPTASTPGRARTRSASLAAKGAPKRFTSRASVAPIARRRLASALPRALSRPHATAVTSALASITARASSTVLPRRAA